MDSPNPDSYLLSRINTIQADLDSKTVAIAEIQRDVGRLCSALLGPATTIVRSDTFSDDSSHRERQAPYRLTYGNHSDREPEDPSSIGTTLTKVSITGAPPLPSIKSEVNPHRLIGSSIGIVGNGGENHAGEASKTLTVRNADRPHTPIYESYVDGEVVDDTHWQVEGLSINGTRTPAPSVGVGGPIASPPLQPTTQIMVNGVPRSIPSSLKGSAPVKKSALAPLRESLGPSEPVFYGRTIRATAPAKVPGWKGGPAPAQVSARVPPTIPEAPPGVAGAERQVSQPQLSRKPRGKGCANCGDVTHILKYCRKKTGKGPEGGENSEKMFHHRPNHPMNQPITRPCEKAPGYPIDRQIELIETILAQTRMKQLGIQPVAVPAFMY
ncbi:hypothetical protein Dda_6113 [Drechslerella dactyloides]|uniref:Uncharacterized protein n=1 Tax=Drechslerella dactyloides TaxID=74499 RepID=A0AAD6IX54_DREDA|nr:hypothetical protein Dda_6113 [Drechslerella dactyloides]